MVEGDPLLPDLEPEVLPRVARRALDRAQEERDERDDERAVGERATARSAAPQEEHAEHDHGRADPDREVELRAPQARRVDHVEGEGAQGPDDAAERVVGRLSGGLAEPSVQRARLDEVQDVPRRPEQDARAAREDARAAAIAGHERENGGDHDRQGERGVELRRQREAQRDAADRELRP